MTVLRIYEPNECDPATGIPLDWAYCRACFGVDTGEYPCEVCAGRGSLKAAALEQLRCRTSGLVVGEIPPVRCEDCGHPLSEGVWKWQDSDAERRFGALTPNREKNVNIALRALREGREPGLPEIHYSLCDGGCRHGGPAQAQIEGDHWERVGPMTGELTDIQLVRRDQLDPKAVRASWRHVDVRCLGWPHDLRPERLAVLCLRCWAARDAYGDEGPAARWEHAPR